MISGVAAPKTEPKKRAIAGKKCMHRYRAKALTPTRRQVFQLIFISKPLFSRQNPIIPIIIDSSDFGKNYNVKR